MEQQEIVQLKRAKSSVSGPCARKRALGGRPAQGKNDSIKVFFKPDDGQRVREAAKQLGMSYTDFLAAAALSVASQPDVIQEVLPLQRLST